MPPKASQLKNETQKCNNALLFWSAVPGYCIDRLQPFQCLIFVAVCHSVASFSTSVLHFSQSLHVGNLISQWFNKSNSLLLRSQAFFCFQDAATIVAIYTFWHMFHIKFMLFLSQPKLFQQWRIWNAMMAQWTDHTSCQRDCCPSSRSPMRGWKQWTNERRTDL